MTGKQPRSDRLREQAEARVAKRMNAVASDTTKALVHELEVHQVELEMQNEELLAARAEIEAGLTRYTQLFDFAPIGYAVLDRNGKIRSANLECARMLGAPRANLVGRLFSLHVANSRPVFERCVAEAWTHDDDARSVCEVDVLSQSGDVMSIRVLAAVLREPEPVMMLALHDVTEKKRIETALREENRRKDEFLAILSHELRNPLAPIRTSLSMLDRAESGSVQATNALAVVRRQVDHLVRIVDDLLDVTRIARGKIVLRKAPLDVGDLVRRAVEDYRADFEAHGISLDVHVPAEPMTVDADAARLTQVLGNLFSNAMKFTPKGGRVWVDAHASDSLAVIVVRDNGAGIAPDVQRRLFQPFVQAPQTLDRSTGGLGLGLATVKGIVELHAGNVSLQSGGTGQGATFVVRLPLVTVPVRVAQAAPEPEKKQRRVLIVEDNVDAANAIRDVLEIDGHEVRVAYDGSSALALARDFRPDVVFCDIGLPGMDGYEVARAMRSDATCKSAYLVALSGYTQPKDRARATEAGFDRHVAKPTDIEELEGIIEKAPHAA